MKKVSLSLVIDDVCVVGRSTKDNIICFWKV